MRRNLIPVRSRKLECYGIKQVYLVPENDFKREEKMKELEKINPFGFEVKIKKEASQRNLDKENPLLTKVEEEEKRPLPYFLKKTKKGCGGKGEECTPHPS